MKLKYTKKEVNELKEKIYLSEMEEKVFDYWLLDKSLVETALGLHISTRNVSYCRKHILDKIEKVE